MQEKLTNRIQCIFGEQAQVFRERRFNWEAKRATLGV